MAGLLGVKWTFLTHGDELLEDSGLLRLAERRPDADRFDLARAASNPASVRSRITSRSNSARAAITWNISLPVGVVVSMFSLRLFNSIPRCSRVCTVSIRSLSERQRRSSRHTTMTSPARAISSLRKNSGRSKRFPLILSVKVRVHCSRRIASGACYRKVMWPGSGPLWEEPKVERGRAISVSV